MDQKEDVTLTKQKKGPLGEEFVDRGSLTSLYLSFFMMNN